MALARNFLLPSVWTQFGSWSLCFTLQGCGPAAPSLIGVRDRHRSCRGSSNLHSNSGLLENRPEHRLCCFFLFLTPNGFSYVKWRGGTKTVDFALVLWKRKSVKTWKNSRLEVCVIVWTFFPPNSTGQKHKLCNKTVIGVCCYIQSTRI